MDTPNSPVNLSSLVNILTLRYNPIQKPILPKYTSKNFGSSTETPSIEKIEKLMFENISAKIPNNIDSIRLHLQIISNERN